MHSLTCRSSMGKLVYQLFLLLYPLAVKLASLFNKKARLWIDGRNAAMSTLLNKGIDIQRPVWFHCASLGEFEQARPVIESIKKQHPDVNILLTFFSPSGYEVQKDYGYADHVMYLPWDSSSNARLFLDIVKPRLVVFVKYEYWYHFLHETHQQGIPLVLISGIFRKSQVFFKAYGSFYREMLSFFTKFFVQDQDSATLLSSLGFQNHIVTGDTRFDRVNEIAKSSVPIPVVEDFCANSKVIVAGSTWLEDDKELAHFANNRTEVKFIVAPHDISNYRIKECLELYRGATLFSELGAAPKSNILIIDNIGMLSRLYAFATVCLIGGGFAGDGVHNVLEAAVYGKPIVHGPVFEKFVEARQLNEAGGSFVVENAVELEVVVDNLLKGDHNYTRASVAAANYVKSNTGATGKTMKEIKAFLY